MRNELGDVRRSQVIITHGPEQSLILGRGGMEVPASQSSLPELMNGTAMPLRLVSVILSLSTSRDLRRNLELKVSVFHRLRAK